MIASVRGEVISRLAGEVVIEASGVGYRMAVSTETLNSVPAGGSQGRLYTHLVLRDDGMHLFGFATEAERELFLMLIGVQWVGPKVALAVLSGGTPRELLNAIASGDSARFQAVPGIGKRTAERIIVELREKVAGKVRDEIVVATRRDDPRTLAREGLLGLGFTPAGGGRAARQGRGRDARGPDRRGAEGGAVSGIRTPGVERIHDPVALPAEDELDRSLRPRKLEDFVGQEPREGAAGGVHRGGARRAARRSTTSCSRARPASARPRSPRSWPTSSARSSSPTAGPALERKGDVASYLTALEPRSVFFVDEIHRLPRALEETFYPGDGGPQAADHRGPGRGRARGHARPAAVHADRRHHARRPAHHAAARPLRRDATGSSSTSPPTSARIVRRSAGILEVEIDDRRRRGDRIALARHPARGQPAAQARARLRRGARRRAASTRAWRPRRSTCSRSTTPGSTGSTARSCARSARSSAAGRSGLSTLAVAVGEERTRSRTSTSRTCSSRA